jgi:flagellar motor protein MotB
MDTQDREHISIWLAYSDLFSGLFVVCIGLVLFSLLPKPGPGDGPGNGGEELRRRKVAQWEVTKRLFEEIKKQGFSSDPAKLDDLKLRFDNPDGNSPKIVRFFDPNNDEVIVIHRPQGEEQRITFGDQVLFDDRGEFLKRIKPNGIALLQSIGPIVLAQGALYDEIRIFGHTDVKPPQQGDGIGYNWNLSAERAIAVVTELLTNREIGQQLSRTEDYNAYLRGRTSLNFPPNRISAIGRGEFEPVGSGPDDSWTKRQSLIYDSWRNETRMQQNRRIEIVLRSSSLSGATH